MRLGNGINSQSEYFDVAWGKRGDRQSENQLEQLSSSESLVTIRLGSGWRTSWDVRRGRWRGSGLILATCPGPGHTGLRSTRILGPLFRGLASVCVTLSPDMEWEEQQSGSRYFYQNVNGHQMFRRLVLVLNIIFEPQDARQLEMDSLTKKQLLFSRSCFIYIELKGLENIVDWAPEIPDAAPQFAYL